MGESSLGNILELLNRQPPLKVVDLIELEGYFEPDILFISMSLKIRAKGCPLAIVEYERSGHKPSKTFMRVFEFRQGKLIPLI